MTILTAIGNSQGIRIPKPLIKQAKLENRQLELIVIDKGLLIRPIHKPNRINWRENIQQILEKNRNQEDKGIVNDLLDDSDLDNWEW